MNSKKFKKAFSLIDAAWLGYISEVIFFDRDLRDSERHDIESYLGKKYKITVTSS